MKRILTIMLAVLVMGTFAFAQQYKNVNTKRLPASVVAKIQQAKSSKKVMPIETKFSLVKSGPMNDISTFPYLQGFENGLDGWTVNDHDGDTHNWALMSSLLGADASEVSHTGTDCIYSASYSNADTAALTPDNWLISPAIVLNDSYELSWYVAALDRNFPDEKYSVYIATVDSIGGFLLTQPIFTETLTSAEWDKRTIDLASYAGQTVYIAFRHYESTDNFVMRIDDIRIGAYSLPEVTLVASENAIMGDSIDFVAQITGLHTTISWIVDDQDVSDTLNILRTVFDTPGEHTVIVNVNNISGTCSDTAIVNVVDCSPIAELPYRESFEEFSFCWQNIDKNNDGFVFTPLSEGMIETTPNSGEDAMVSMSAFAFLGMVFPIPQDNYLVSRKVVIPSEVEGNIFGIFAKSCGEVADSFAVYVTTTMPDTNTVFTAEQTIIPLQGANVGDYALYTASLSAFAGSEVYFVIRHVSFGAGALAIDDIYVGENEMAKPVITAPIDVRVGKDANFSVRSISAATNVTYRWEFENAVIDTAVGENVTAKWDTAGIYDVTVYASNDQGESDTTIQFSVYDCSPISTFPDTTNFAAMVDTRCWDVVDANNDGSSWYLYPELGIVNNSLNFETGAPITPNDYLISPTYSVPAEGNYEFYYILCGGNPQAPAEHYSVYVSTEGKDIANFTTPIIEETLSDQLYMRSIDLTEYAGQDVNIAIRHHDCSGQVGLVFVGSIARAMEAPVVDTLIGPSYTRVGDSVSYEVYVQGYASKYAWSIDGGAADTTLVPIYRTAFTTEGVHSLSVTAINVVGNSTKSISVNVVDCPAVTEYPYVDNFDEDEYMGCWNVVDADGDGNTWMNFYSMVTQNGAYIGANGSVGCAGSLSRDLSGQQPYTPDNWMISPAFVIPAGEELHLSWKVATQIPELSAENYSVYIATENTIEAFEATEPIFTEMLEDADWHERAYNLTNYVGKTIYIAFRHHECEGQYLLKIDDITITTGHVGIDVVSNIEMNLYPNPTTGMISINAEGIEQIEVLDVNGRVVMTQNNENLVNMSGLSNGVYFVRVITKEGIAVQKVIKR